MPTYPLLAPRSTEQSIYDLLTLIIDTTNNRVNTNNFFVDSSGNIYLANFSDSTIKKYNASGAYQTTITLTGG